MGQVLLPSSAFLTLIAPKILTINLRPTSANSSDATTSHSFWRVHSLIATWLTSNLSVTCVLPSKAVPVIQCFLHKLSCDVVSPGPGDKRNSYSSLGQGSNVPWIRVFFPNPSRRWPLSLGARTALVIVPASTLVPSQSIINICLLVYFPASANSPKADLYYHSLTQGWNKICFPWIFVE